MTKIQDSSDEETQGHRKAVQWAQEWVQQAKEVIYQWDWNYTIKPSRSSGAQELTEWD